MFLLTSNLQSVLFPILSKLNSEPDRQFQAIRNSCRTLMVLAVFVCALQSVLADSVITWLFGARWRLSIPVVQWVSIGLLAQPVGLLASSVLLAQGRYRQLALVTTLTGALVAGGATAGAVLGEIQHVAGFIGLSIFASNLFLGWSAFNLFGSGLKGVFQVAGRPLAVSLPILAVGSLLNSLLAARPDAVRALIVAVACTLCYYLIIRAAFPEMIETIRLRFQETDASTTRQS